MSESNKSFFLQALKCKCPRCHVGDLYKVGLNADLRPTCAECGLDFSKNDSADGPAVFMIFVLGFLLVPLALLFDAYVSPPLWVHAILWLCVALGMTIGMLKPLKSFVIAQQYKHRPEDWT